MRYSRVGGMNLFQSQLRPFKLHSNAAFVGALAVTCCLLMGISPANAGPASAGVRGVTVNALGATVPGVRVSVRSMEDNTDRNTVSDRDGTFVVDNLSPGRYQLRATKGGLASSTMVSLVAQQDLRVDLTLVPAERPTPVANPNLAADLHTPAAGSKTGEAPLTDREKLLLDRLDKLEQRLEAMEAKQASLVTPAASAPPAPVALPAKTSATTVAPTQPALVTAASPGAASTAAPAKHTLLASLGGAIGLKSAEKTPAISIPPTKQAAATPAPAATHTLPEALEAPEPAPPNSETVYNWADYTWMNGNTRTKDTILDTKFFTPEVRFDTHYMNDFNQPNDHTMGGATESFRSGEVQLEQVSVGGDFHWQNVRGRVLYMDGLFATTTPRNDGSAGVGEWDVRGAYKYVSEAWGGYHFNVNRGLNVDAGIFVSYIGLFSYYNFDNWTYQPSYVSSNTPWFFNGLRIQWFPTKKLKIEPWIINGWQSYNEFNHHRGFGGQIMYRPTGWLAMVFNNYGNGTDTLNNPARSRIHTDDSIEVKYFDHPRSNGIDKMAFSLTGDLGCEYGGGVSCTGKGAPKQAFLGWMGYDRIWWGKDKYAITYGGGKMNNPGRYLTLLPPINGADAISGSPYFTANPGDKAHMWDTTLTFQWMPKQYITWWLEAGYRNSDIPYFTGRHGITPPGGNNGTPGAYVCNSGAAAYTAINNSILDLADATTFCAANGNGGVWFPDLRKTQGAVSAGIMVKF